MPWILKKPFLYICRQWLGRAKGDLFYAAHLGRLGEIYRAATPDELEKILDSIPETRLMEPAAGG